MTPGPEATGHRAALPGGVAARRSATVLLAIAAGVGTAGPTHAQPARDRAPTIHVTPYVGYAVFGDYFDAPAGVSFTNDDAPIVGAQVGYALTPAVSVVGHLGHARSDWRLSDLPLLGDVDLADAGLWLYDAGVQFRLPSVGRVGAGLTPFVQVGAGAIRYTLGDEALARLIGADDATNLAGNVGIGMDAQLNRALGLRLMAKDYIASFESVEAEAFRAEGRVAHSWTFTAGVTFGF